MRARIVDAAYGIFYKEGFGRARVEAIAECAGVSKRTFYYHFPSKDVVLAAVLESQHEVMLTRIGEWTRRAQGNPERMVAILFDELAAWAGTPKFQGSGFTRSVMELADLPGHPARAIARRHKAAVEAWLCDQLREQNIVAAKHIARQIMLLMEGCQLLMLIHGDIAYAKSARAAATTLLQGAKTKR